MSMNLVVYKAYPMRFAQLGLLVGSFTSWQKDLAGEQSQCLENLMQWTLHLPGFSIDDKKCYRPRLGISANGFALIYYTLLQAKKRQASLNDQQQLDAEEVKKALIRAEEVKEALIRLGISRSTLQQIEGPQPPYDRYTYPHFNKPFIDHFYDKYAGDLSSGNTARPHFASEPRRSSYIWLDDKDSITWVTAIKETLNDLTKKLPLYEVMRFGERLECSIFAPLDISQPLPCQINGMLTSEMPKELNDRIIEVHDELHRSFKKMQEKCGEYKTPRYLYLSWDLLAFDYWRDAEDEKLLYRTILALWAKWPRDEVWAPPGGLPENFSSPPFSLEEATCLFDVLRHVRRYFWEIKDAHQLLLEEQKFDTRNQSRTCYPPTFYFADPTTRLPTTAAYVEDTNVRHLLSYFLGYDDPHADTLSWSTLEGSMATVRGEAVREDHYKPRYLLFPISDGLQSDKEIEGIKKTGVNIDNIVDILSLCEYTIAMEAVEINDKKNDIVINDTDEIRDHFIQPLARVVPALSTEERENCVEEFAPLQLALGRLQSALEKTKKDATQLEQRYYAIIKRAERSSGASIAMKDAYPYRILREEMTAKPLPFENLANNHERINSLLTLLSTATLDRERRQHEFITTFVAILSVFIAILGVLFTVLLLFPNFDILSTLGAIGTSSTGQIILAVVGIILLVLSLHYNWYNWLKRKIDRYKARRESSSFHKHVQKFWKLAIYTTKLYRRKDWTVLDLSLSSKDLSLPAKFEERWNNGAGADKIDSEATTILQGLLSSLKERPSTGEDIVRNARRFIYIFVLYPELIPLPRTLCILRFKSLQYIGAPSIRNNDFRDSLKCAGFTCNQVEALQSWLDQPENSQWIRNRDISVETVARALKKAGVRASPSDMSNWQKSQPLSTFSQESH